MRRPGDGAAMEKRMGSGTSDSSRSLFHERASDASDASDDGQAAADNHGLNGGTRPEAIDHRTSCQDRKGDRGDPALGRDPYQDEGGEG